MCHTACGTKPTHQMTRHQMARDAPWPAHLLSSPIFPESLAHSVGERIKRSLPQINKQPWVITAFVKLMAPVSSTQQLLVQNPQLTATFYSHNNVFPVVWMCSSPARLQQSLRNPVTALASSGPALGLLWTSAGSITSRACRPSCQSFRCPCSLGLSPSKHPSCWAPSTDLASAGCIQRKQSAASLVAAGRAREPLPVNRSTLK